MSERDNAAPQVGRDDSGEAGSNHAREPAVSAPQSEAGELVKRAEEYLLGDDLTGSEVDRICELVVRLTAENAALRKALLIMRSACERSEHNLNLAIMQKPVRDLAETFGECRYAYNEFDAAMKEKP